MNMCRCNDAWTATTTSNSCDTITRMTTTKRRTTAKMIEAVIFVWLGIGVLWPWNAFISAKSYMTQRMPKGTDWEAWCSTLFNGGSVLSLVFWLLLHTPRRPQPSQQRVHPNHSTLLETSRNLHREDFWVWLSLGLYLGVFVLTTLGVLWVPSSTSTTACEWWFQLGSYGGIIACGMATSVASAGIVGMAAATPTSSVRLSKRGIGSARNGDDNSGIAQYFTGQAIGGLVVAIGNWVTQWYDLPTTNFNRNQQDSSNHGTHNDAATTMRYTQISWPTFWYFLISCLVLGLCILGYTYLAVHDTSPCVMDRTGDGEEEDFEDCEDHRLLHGTNHIDEDGSHCINESTPLVVQRNFGLHSFDCYCSSNITITHCLVRESPSTTSFESTNSSCCSLTVNDTLESVRPTSFSHSTVITTPTMSSSSMESSSSDDDEEVCSCNQVHHLSSAPTTKHRVLHPVWDTIAEPTAALFMTYFVTLLLFPVWTSGLTSTMTDLNQHSAFDQNVGWYYFKKFYIDMYTPWTFCIFNFGDLIGRMAASHVHMSKDRLLPASLLRLVFLGFFCYCPTSWSNFDFGFNNHSINSNNGLIGLLLVDAYSWTIQLLMAISNGYLTTMAFQLTPTLLQRLPGGQEASYQVAASTILNLSMSLGLCCGSAASFAYVDLSQWLLQQLHFQPR